MDNKEKLNFKEVGARIRSEREMLDLTREKFAEIVGLSSFYIGQIERGDRKMSIDTLINIASALHVSVDYLLYGSNLYAEKFVTEKHFSILETANNSYDQPLNDDLQELLAILNRCSNREISLIKDITKLILPYLTR